MRNQDSLGDDFRAGTRVIARGWHPDWKGAREFRTPYPAGGVTGTIVQANGDLLVFSRDDLPDEFRTEMTYAHCLDLEKLDCGDCQYCGQPLN